MKRLLVFIFIYLFMPVNALHANDFYVDPTNGSPSGDGSAEHPWRTIQEVLEAGLVESQNWDSLPYDEGRSLVPINQEAPVKPDDRIFLLTGYHGELVIESHYNSRNITIAALEGHTPKLKKIHIRSSSKWTLRGLHVSPEFAPSYEVDTLVNLESHDWRGPIHEITVEECELQSVADTSSWSAEDWNNRACDGFRVDGTDMIIQDNKLRNVNFGISVNATFSFIERNVVENFAGDGMRGLGDNTTFAYNIIKNCYAVNQNHDDGFQSWSVGEDGQVGTGEVYGIVLKGNIIINYEDPNQPHRGTLQGIGCFDGMFVNWVVENNVVITDHWHGITLLGARGSIIINNTVLDPNGETPGPPWIRIGPHKQGTPSTSCTVRNNLLTTAINVDDGQDVQADHNLIFSDSGSLFVDAASGDLHLLKNAPAIDMGSMSLAPLVDIDGVPRPQGSAVDIGAYEYCPYNSCIPTEDEEDTRDGNPTDSGVDDDTETAPSEDTESGPIPDGGERLQDASMGNSGETSDKESGCNCSSVGRMGSLPIPSLWDLAFLLWARGK